MSNLNKWDSWYRDLESPSPYGDTATYYLAADFLGGAEVIEDWGCGAGFFKSVLPSDQRYIGVDGSWSIFANTHADLERYTSDADCILLRHVLEHNYGWENILKNAVASFTDRLLIILFTPMADKTTEIVYNLDPGVPDLSFSFDDIQKHLVGLNTTVAQVKTSSQYGMETLFYVQR